MNQTPRSAGFVRKGLILGCLGLLCLFSAQAQVIVYKHSIIVADKIDPDQTCAPLPDSTATPGKSVTISRD
jgi:hypothetical protein